MTAALTALTRRPGDWPKGWLAPGHGGSANALKLKETVQWPSGWANGGE